MRIQQHLFSLIFLFTALAAGLEVKEEGQASVATGLTDTERYKTAELVIFQSFFDTLSSEFIPPLLEGLNGI